MGNLQLFSELSREGIKKRLNLFLDSLLTTNYSSNQIDDIVDNLLKNPDTSRFEKNKLYIKSRKIPIKQILVFLIAFILIFALIPGNLPRVYGSLNPDISISVYPTSVNNGDMMFINVTIPDYYNVSTVSVDMNGTATIDLFLVDNSSSDYLWQTSWFVHNITEGEHFAKVNAYDDSDTLHSAQIEFLVINENDILEENFTDINQFEDSLDNLTVPDTYSTVNIENDLDDNLINATNAKYIFDKNESVIIFDIRSYDVYRLSHIADSISISIVESDCDPCLRSMLEGYINNTIIIYGYNVTSLKNAYDILLKLNFSDIYLLKETINACKDAGFNIETLPDEDNVELRIDNSLAAGKPVFLYFYLDECNYCQQEEVVLEELKEEYSEKIEFIDLFSKSNFSIKTYSIRHFEKTR